MYILNIVKVKDITCQKQMFELSLGSTFASSVTTNHMDMRNRVSFFQKLPPGTS